MSRIYCNALRKIQERLGRNTAHIQACASERGYSSMIAVFISKLFAQRIACNIIQPARTDYYDFVTFFRFSSE